MPCVIRNRSVEPLSLPYPFAGILPGGKAVILDLTVAAVTTALGGSSFLGGVALEEAPAGYSGPYDSFFEGDAAGGGTAIPAGRVPYGNAGGTNLTSEAALAYDASTNNLTVGTVTTASVGPDSNSLHTLPDVAADTVVLLAATQTLSGKTLTTPNIAHVRDAAGAAGYSISATASAVNGLVLENSATGVYVSSVPGAPAGSDANITWRLRAKGTGAGELVNPANTAVRLVWGATGMGFWGAAEAAQPAAEADLTPTVAGDMPGPTAAEIATRLNLIETKLNNLLAKLRTPGLIAT